MSIQFKFLRLDFHFIICINDFSNLLYYWCVKINWEASRDFLDNKELKIKYSVDILTEKKAIYLAIRNILSLNDKRKHISTRISYG